ncbi:MAG: FAD-binding oxidoreductase [bacterium]|nr:FAD-binding oxidoreductase [bacterium]
MFYHEIRFDINYDPENLRWNGWGSEGHEWQHEAHIPALKKLLIKELKAPEGELPETPSVSIEDLNISASKFGDKEVKELGGIVGKDGVSVERRMRILHSAGQSYYDVVRLRTNQLKAYTDGVVFPKKEAQLAKLFTWCAKNKVALIPYGGGSSVVGGLEVHKASGQRAVLTANLTRMNELLELDEFSRIARFQPGIYGPQIEKTLNERGFTLGHFPQSFEYSTLGGWVAARSGGQQSNRYGKIEEMITAVKVATPAGVIETLRVPAEAAGPDWNQVIAGSEGLLGIITEVTVKIHRLPEGRRYFGVLFPSFRNGANFVREVSNEGEGYDLSMVRLSDAEETRMYSLLSEVTKKKTLLRPIKKAVQESVLRAAGQGAGRCVVIAGMDGEVGRMNRQEIRVRKAIRKHGGFYAGESVGKNWIKGRFNMPFLRNHVLDFGVGVDTLETSTTYANVEELHSEVLKALEAVTPHIVAFCHMSHSYHEGSCLYFSFMFLMDTKDPIGQWRKLKKAASDVLVRLGATISHHHGVGADHVPWYHKQNAGAAIGGLQAMKAAVDPAGILNPGKVFDGKP